MSKINLSSFNPMIRPSAKNLESTTQVPSKELTVTKSHHSSAVYSNSIISPAKTVKISLAPNQINRDYLNHIRDELRQQYEGKISNSGYLLPGTINLLSVSNGSKMGSHFTGKMTFEVKFSADYYVPKIGTELICQVLTVNKVGVLANSILFPYEIIIPRHLQSNPQLVGHLPNDLSTSFGKINKNDLINVQVVDFTAKSNNLTIVGIVTGVIAYSSEEYELSHRVLRLNGQLYNSDYTVYLNESNLNNRSVNPFQYLAQISSRLVAESETLTTLLGEEGDHNKIKTFATELSTHIATVRQTVNTMVGSNKLFKQLSNLLIDELIRYNNELKTLITNLTSLIDDPDLELDGGLISPELNLSEFEQSVNASGLAFFDNRLKSDIERLHDRLEILIGEEKSTIKSTSSILWDGFIRPSDRKKILGIRSLINPYELISDKYKQEISGNMVNSRAYFKMIEINETFQLLADFKDRPLLSYHVAEGPGGFIHAVADSRRKTYANYQKDEYIGITRKFQWTEGRLRLPFKTDEMSASEYDNTLQKFYQDLWHDFAQHKIDFIRHITEPIKLQWQDPKFGFLAYRSNSERRESVENLLNELNERDFYEWFEWSKKASKKGFLRLTYFYDRHQPTSHRFFLPVDPEEGGKIDWDNNYYAKELPKRYPQIQLLYGGSHAWDRGNIMNNDLLFTLAKNKKHYHRAQLVTADGGFEEDSTLKELKHAKLFFHEILWGLVLLQEGGHFVLKIYDIHWQITYEIIGLLTIYFNDVYLFKPKTSRQANSEKYVVCKYFKGISPENLAVLRNLSNEWNRLTTETATFDLHSDNQSLTIVYGLPVKLEFINNLETYLNLYRRKKWIQDYQQINNGEIYQIKLSPELYQILKESQYRVNELFFLSQEKSNTVNRIINSSFNTGLRDLITGFQNQLHINQLATLDRGVTKLYEDAVKSLKKPTLIKTLFNYDLPIDVPPKELAQNLLEKINNDETVEKLESLAEKWLESFLGGGAPLPP